MQWAEHMHKTCFLSSPGFESRGWTWGCATGGPFRTEPLFLPPAGSAGRGGCSAESPSKPHKGRGQAQGHASHLGTAHSDQSMMRYEGLAKEVIPKKALQLQGPQGMSRGLS